MKCGFSGNPKTTDNLSFYDPFFLVERQEEDRDEIDCRFTALGL
jgi:hypothetical protein